MINKDLFDAFLETALQEDLGDGDHSSLACIPAEARGKAKLHLKDEGIIAGLEITSLIFRRIDPELKIEFHLRDGDRIKSGDTGFTVSGTVQSILKSERIVLNVLQRMSGIATQTDRYVQKIKDLRTKIMDTRKTTPGMRILDKEAVRIGGGENHRMGLYDMIMLKDNHIDFAGGITQAIRKTNEYLDRTGKALRIEVEARGLEDVREIIRAGHIHRIMLDNFSLEDTRRAVALIAGRYETESSGKITLDNLREYAACGVDYISVGALTHQIQSLDFSLKASD
ncbi:MAG: nicotinate-nucleotide pyrophosphorylase [Bacteroides sp. SM1_62]|nr:MAG: nicotinate-nucleotide pyrophosphorylase [Bacteroides sp. SM23_62]KPL25082.1 MAG: nicotinate-nucleotide pyrophosphorylase [Bacteroides sp. SM1_62]